MWWKLFDAFMFKVIKIIFVIFWLPLIFEYLIKVIYNLLKINILFILANDFVNNGIYAGFKWKLFLKLLKNWRENMRALPEKWEYVPECDRDLPQNEQTVFILKRVPFQRLSSFEDNLYEAKGYGKKRTENIKTGSHAANILKIGLVNWRNFKDVEGNDIPFTGNVDDFSLIPGDVRRELVEEITGVTKEEE